MKDIQLDENTKKLMAEAIVNAQFFEKWSNSDKEEDKEKARKLLSQIATIDNAIYKAAFGNFNMFEYAAQFVADNNEED